MPSSTRKKPTPAPLSYEQALSELEHLLGQLESGQMPLDQLIQTHRRGNELLAFCRAQLQAVEQQFQVLEGDLSKPWSAA